MGDSPRAEVDRDRCYSYGTCVDILPDIFQFDDMGISVARDRVRRSLSELIDTAQECPVQAISVYAPDGTRVYPG